MSILMFDGYSGYSRARRSGPLDYIERLLPLGRVVVTLVSRASGKAIIDVVEIGVLGDRAEVTDLWFLVGHCTSQCR